MVAVQSTDTAPGEMRLSAALQFMSPSRFDEAAQLKAEPLLAAALTMQVGRHELGWLARNKPLELERLMDQTQPDAEHFWAIALVYEAYEQRVRPRAEWARRERQVRTLNGLACRGKRRGMRVTKRERLRWEKAATCN